MNDDRIRDLLRALPRVDARPGFTDQVLAEIEQPARGGAPRPSRRPARRPGARSGGWSRLVAIAATFAVAAVLVGAGAWRLERERSAARARAELELLRAEQQALAAELASMREATSTDLYLGGNDDVDLVFDVSRTRRPIGAQPVSLRNAD